MNAEVTPRRRVYVVAPDDALMRALAEQRRPQSGWRIAAPNGTPEPESLVILDLEAADERRRWIQTLRSDGYAGPVLVLGGEAESPDDEPVARPVRLGTLLARLDAHAADLEGADRYLLGIYEFSPADRALRHRDDGGTIRLTELERKLLSSLAEAGGAVIEREQLLARVWGYSADVDTHTVETHVWRLRQKIETDDPATHVLVTEPGGYRVILSAG